jgi:hypothetical protein
MTERWQKINERCHSCHSWRNLIGSRLSAMTTATVLILIVALAVAAIIAETLREAFHDGPAPQGPPRSHPDDARFLPPGARAS